jgi:hypothetical protein
MMLDWRATIVLGGFFLLAAWLIGGNYTVVVADKVIWTVNRFTGSVRACSATACIPVRDVD